MMIAIGYALLVIAIILLFARLRVQDKNERGFIPHTKDRRWRPDRRVPRDDKDECLWPQRRERERRQHD